MTKVPGLTPFIDDRPGPQGRKETRVMVEEPASRRQRLTPTATPVNTFVQAAKPQVNSNFDELMNGLAKLNPAIVRFATVMNDEKKEDDTAYANREAARSTAEEFRVKMAQDPRLQSAVTKARSAELMAEKDAQHDLANSVQEYANDVDKEKLPFDKWLAAKRDTRLSQYEGNRHYSEAYIKATGPGFAKLFQAHTDHQIQAQRTQQLNGVDAAFGNIIENGKLKGESAEETSRKFWAEVAGNKLTLNMSQEEQDKVILQRVEAEAAKGNYDLVKGLLGVDRLGRDGVTVSLLNNRATSKQASVLLERAEAQRNENNKKASADANLEFYRQASEGTLDEAAFEEHVKKSPGAITEEQRRAVLQSNGRNRTANAETATKLEQERELKVRLQDQDLQMETDALTAARDGQIHNLGPRTVLKKDGETKEMSPKEVQEWAEEKFIQRSSERAQKDGETPEQQFDRELKIVSRNGMTHPTWKRTMTAGAASLSGVALTADKPPTAFAQGYAMYRDLKAKAPHMIGRHIDSNSRELYESARIAEVELGMSPDRALIAAHRATADPDAANSPLNRSKADDIRAKARSQNTWMPTFLGGSPDIANLGEVAIEIEGRAMLYARLGLSADDALVAAGKTLETTHININGFLVPRMGHRIPADFKKRAETFIRGYANEYGKAEGLDAGDLTVRPIGEDANAWMIYNKKTNSPVFAGQHRSFSLQQIEQLAEYERARAQQENERVSAARVEKHQANRALPADKRQLPVAGGIEWKTPLDVSSQ